MFIKIPDYPNYQFNPETLEVRSLNKGMRLGTGNYARPGRILKPLGVRGDYVFSLYNENGQKTFRRSQISWLVHYGNLPEKPLQIDHIDADKSNDCWENLQILNPRQNTSKGYQDNGTKYPTGVSWYKKTGKFRAAITIDGKIKHLCYLDSLAVASLAYQKALGVLNA